MRLNYWILTACLGALSACGLDLRDDGAIAEPFWLDGKSGDGGSGDASADGGSSGTDDLPLAGDVSGTVTPGQGPSSAYYAFWNQSRVLAHNAAPFGDEWQPSRTTTVGVMRIDWLGNNGQAWLVPCGLHSSEVASSQLSYPTGFINALAEGPFPVQRDGNDIIQPGKTQWLGLQQGYLGDLPDPGDAKHPAVVDIDMDGHPGATIFIHMPFFGDQEIYVAERNTTKWTAARQPDGSFVALPESLGVKITLGATQSILVMANTDKALPDEAPEELRLVPTTADTGCAALMAAPEQFTGMSFP